jgi:hypothetical protein
MSASEEDRDHAIHRLTYAIEVLANVVGMLPYRAEKGDLTPAVMQRIEEAFGAAERVQGTLMLEGNKRVERDNPGWRSSAH